MEAFRGIAYGLTISAGLWAVAFLAVFAIVQAVR